MVVNEIVRAAGGVVYRSTEPPDVQVLLVHRPGYDDWTFPKGKLKPDEREEAAALREVEEETGLRCRLERELSGVTYRDKKGRPKIVHYWVMRPLGGEFSPTDEVDEIRWLSIGDALEALTYEHDKVLLRMFAANSRRRRRGPTHPADAPTTPIYVVRHAKAGSRDDWDQDDELRPLDEAGFRQAEGLVDLMEALPIDRIIASPAVRCVATVELLARTREIPLTTDPRLAEGTPPDVVDQLLREVSERATLVCTHGDVVGHVLDRLGEGKVVDPSEPHPMKKGSTWVIDHKDRAPVGAHYLPPP